MTGPYHIPRIVDACTTLPVDTALTNGTSTFNATLNMVGCRRLLLAVVSLVAKMVAEQQPVATEKNPHQPE
jgi:hypothetical protein